MKILIAHAAWLPERRRTLGRLLEQVPDAKVLSSKRQEHASVWARRAWEWCEGADDDVCILNDDVTVCPDFIAVLDAMVTSAPGKILSLHTSIPDAVLAQASWVRSYWLTGPAYVLPRGAAKQLLDYAARLPWLFVSRFNEDNLAIHYAWEKQEPFWSSIPAIVAHDTDTKSSLGYDNHPMRNASVPWTAYPDAKLTDPAYWQRGAEQPRYLDNPWMKTEYLEAVRRGLELKATCSGCWQRPAIVQTSGIMLCGMCLSRGVESVLKNARVS